MALHDLSLGDLYVAWTVVFSVILAPIALAMAPDDVRGIAQYLAAAAGLASILGAWFAVAVWIVTELAN
jgi:hypothetical protein